MTQKYQENQDDEAEMRLAVLVTELADQANQGKQVSLEEACLQNPEFETDLRELWGTIIVTEAAAKEQSQFSSSTRELAIPQLELPCDFGDYRLEEEIGRGGMGIVYRCITTSSGIQMLLYISTHQDGGGQ